MEVIPMSKSQQHAALCLAGALIAGALLQAVAKQEAALLGLSTLELLLLGAGASALATRLVD
jgi:hypothetical protein